MDARVLVRSLIMIEVSVSLVSSGLGQTGDQKTQGGELGS